MPKSKFAILAISAAFLIGLLYLTYLSLTAVTASVTAVQPKIGAAPSCPACTLDWCTPEPGYDLCYEYSYGDAYARVQSTHLYIYSGTHDIVRGLVQNYKISGAGTVSAYWNNRIPSCDASGCNGIAIPTKGEIIYGVYDVDVGTAASTLDVGDGIRLKVTPLSGYLVLYKTQPSYIDVGHSLTSRYWCYAWLGWGEDATGDRYYVKSALVPESIDTSPSNPTTEDEVEIVLTIRNYCKYRAAQLFTITTYDENGNVYHPPSKHKIWISGGSTGTARVGKYIFSEEGTYKIEVKSPDGETWSKKITVSPPPTPTPTPPPVPVAYVEIEQVVGYAVAGAAVAAALLYTFRR